MKFTAKIESLIAEHSEKFGVAKQKDDQQKQEHLRLFRPNLANPANKDATQQLNAEEQKRYEVINEVSRERIADQSVLTFACIDYR